MGLRERQKAGRRQRILEMAQARFQSDGYAAVTMEAIAGDAEVSVVTIYNHFNTKAGLLLALVAESDEILIRQLKALIAAKSAGFIDTVARFGQILRQHAMSYLTKATWREVVAASIQEGSGEFGRTYLSLDRELVNLMRLLIVDFRERGEVPGAIDEDDLADCLFSLQNIRFFQFIADDEIGDEQIDHRFRADLKSLSALFGRTS
ncbi:TetR/AcrR family transcriptional regulator [Ensifer sp. ENS05]|uniref:TetR/AcrR family transcriptional regulator n=1 Tax=Ensifer sp. ENS05 TaxID=2769277 RepID=UPI0017816923|nr:TetR/AcrR family transcriptional regulator [Ensifer sp. ENS05]MBD9596898.1 TetR/AcrR family transcriptional regulator [Ensifer sp. ENS05]